MRQGESKNHFGGLLEAILAAIALIGLLMMTSSCASLRKAEPSWEPHVYLISQEGGRCKFIDGYGGKIDCMGSDIHNFALIRLNDLMSLQEKMQRCEKWK